MDSAILRVTVSVNASLVVDTTVAYSVLVDVHGPVRLSRFTEISLAWFVTLS